jgi:hypothetical protein
MWNRNQLAYLFLIIFSFLYTSFPSSQLTGSSVNLESCTFLGTDSIPITSSGINTLSIYNSNFINCAQGLGSLETYGTLDISYNTYKKKEKKKKKDKQGEENKDKK